MKNCNYIVALLGKSASGKSSVEQVLEKDCGYKRVISTTTRKMRSNETNHADYHFINDDEFQVLIDNNELVEYRYYNTIQDGKPTIWHYGVERKEINLSQHSYVCVVDLVGLEDLKKEFGYKVISIYVDVPEEIRRIRAIARDRFFEEDEWKRRNADDDIKFKDVEKIVDAVVINNSFDECLAGVLHFINKTTKERTFFTQYTSW